MLPRRHHGNPLRGIPPTSTRTAAWGWLLPGSPAHACRPSAGQVAAVGTQAEGHTSSQRGALLGSSWRFHANSTKHLLPRLLRKTTQQLLSVRPRPQEGQFPRQEGTGCSTCSSLQLGGARDHNPFVSQAPSTLQHHLILHTPDVSPRNPRKHPQTAQKGAGEKNKEPVTLQRPLSWGLRCDKTAASAQS